MDEYARTGGMQRARDFGADAPRAAGDQHHLVPQGGSAVDGNELPDCRCHASERYRIVRTACTHA